MQKVNRPQHRTSGLSVAFVENTRYLKKFLKRFVSNPQDIEDIVQEAYLRAFLAERSQGIECPKAFLSRVAQNVVFTKLKKKSLLNAKDLGEAGFSSSRDTAASADEEAEAQELLVQYCKAVAALPDKCREAFLLRKIYGLRLKEIAVRMSLSVSSVEKYIRQGELTCKAYLGDFL